MLVNITAGRPYLFLLKESLEFYFSFIYGNGTPGQKQKYSWFRLI